MTSATNDFWTAIETRFNARGEACAVEAQSASKLLLIWLNYLRSEISHRVADELLDAVRGSILEFAGCIALGLVRPALFALRVQLELVLAWIYFNDHPVEWRHFQWSDKEIPLRAFYVKYLRDYNSGFDARLGLLKQKAVRQHDDPYSVLSAHVHAVSQTAMPLYENLKDLVGSEVHVDQCLTMQVEVGEYLSDVLVSWFAKNWIDFPTEIRASIQSRLTAADLADLLR